MNETTCSRILDDEFETKRIIRIYGEIDHAMAMAVTSGLMYLDGKSDEAITLIINSPGGSLPNVIDIYDCMKAIRSNIITIGVGVVSSAAVVLLAAGKKGCRFVAPNTEIMVNKPPRMVQDSVDAMSQVAMYIQQKRTLIEILATECGKTQALIMKAIERDCWMTAEEAREFGLADYVAYPNLNPPEGEVSVRDEECADIEEEEALMDYEPDDEAFGPISKLCRKIDAMCEALQARMGGEPMLREAVLISEGAFVPAVVWAIRKHIGISGEDAWEIVKNLPHPFTFDSAEKAEAFCKEIEAAGGVAVSIGVGFEEDEIGDGE